VLAGLVLLGVELSEPVMLSGWHFGTVESGAGLDISITRTTLPFLLLTIILMLVMALITLPSDTPGGASRALILGTGAMLLFVSANQLTLAYTVFLFDILLAYHWLVCKQANLSVAHLFLGIFTAGALMLTVEPASTTLVGLALWLRLGLYPFFEIRAVEKQVQNYNFLAYWSLSLAVGMYLVSQILTTPLPEILRWPIVITMLLSGLLAWLFETGPRERPTLLTRLIFTQASLLLLLVNASTDAGVAFALGLTLSLAALWITPQLGQINSNNLAKFWPYLAPLTATLTLIGLPYLLNWPVWATFYQASYSSEMIKPIFIMLAITLAMSGLARYWLKLWRGESTSNGQSHLLPAIAAIIAAVPFLIPRAAPFIISAIMQTDLPTNPDGIPLILITITTAGAIGLGYFREQIITYFTMSPAALTKIFALQWLLSWTEKALSQISKYVLRVNIILEGQHYMGWALVTALVGTLIVILMRNV
jgi:hypothetical protein